MHRTNANRPQRVVNFIRFTSFLIVLFNIFLLKKLHYMGPVLFYIFLLKQLHYMGPRLLEDILGFFRSKLYIARYNVLN